MVVKAIHHIGQIRFHLSIKWRPWICIIFLLFFKTYQMRIILLFIIKNYRLIQNKANRVLLFEILQFLIYINLINHRLGYVYYIKCEILILLHMTKFWWICDNLSLGYLYNKINFTHFVKIIFQAHSIIIFFLETGVDGQNIVFFDLLKLVNLFLSYSVNTA